MVNHDDHIPLSRCDSIAGLKIKNSSVDSLFHHWQSCPKCQHNIFLKRKNNPVFRNPENISRVYNKSLNVNNFHFDIAYTRPGIRSIKFSCITGSKTGEITEQDSPVIKSFYSSIKSYLSGNELFFNRIDPALIRTDFQKKVLFWTTLIPWGQTVNYGKLAEWLNLNCAQAIGQALKKNPLPLIIPCHRVIGKDGSLTGFGAGLELKEKLLKIEKVKI
jgi:O-6-methylguanine DNA methyltransferase